MELVRVVEELEQGRVERVVRHTRTCWDCGGAGGGVTCWHGANCPCRGQYASCETCEGTGVVHEDWCQCERCVALMEEEGLT